MAMRKLLIPFLLMILQSCSSNHAIEIQNNPCLIPYRDYDFILCEPLLFSIDNVYYSVPAGFETDLASVPRILWSIYSPSKAETIPGAVIHDFLYSGVLDVTRKEADSILFDALILKGTPQITAFKYWAAVRLFGNSHFKQYQKQRTELEKHND